MNAHLFDSSDDYHNALRTPAELLAQDIMDHSASEVMMDRFERFILNKYGDDYEEAVEFAEGYLKTTEEFYYGNL